MNHLTKNSILRLIPTTLIIISSYGLSATPLGLFEDNFSISDSIVADSLSIFESLNELIKIFLRELDSDLFLPLLNFDEHLLVGD